MASFLCFKFGDGMTPTNLVIHVIPGVPMGYPQVWPAEGSVPRTCPGDGRASAAALPPRGAVKPLKDPVL